MEEKDWIFTFGFGQAYQGRYVKIFGTCESTNKEMHNRFGPKWSMQYDGTEQKTLDMIERYNYVELK